MLKKLKFYEDLQDLLKLTPKKDLLFIIGNWNAKVGSQEIPGVTGKFGLGIRNEAGQRLIEFCQENALVIAAIALFQQHKRRLYTWTSPDGQSCNQMDYVLCSQRWRSSIQSAKIRLRADDGSDNELLIAKFRLTLKKVRKITRPFSSVQFSHSVVSNSMQPHELHHARPPCPSPTLGVHPNPCPLSQRCHPTISSSVVPSFSCPQSFPASESFQMSQLFTSGGQSIGDSASASVLPKNIRDWSLLGWTGWISLHSKRISRVSFNTTVQKHKFFGTWLSL